MPKTQSQKRFNVRLNLQAAGPIRPRAKYKEHKLLQANGRITLPFVPYPGMYITMTKPNTRGQALTLRLRVRTVEWEIPAEEFVCVVDEILGSNVFTETMEVRGSPRIEQHFTELGKTLKEFSFKVDTNAQNIFKLTKDADGNLLEPPDSPPPASQSKAPRRRRYGWW